METKERDKEISGFSSVDPHKRPAAPAVRGGEAEPAPRAPQVLPASQASGAEQAADKPLLLVDIDGVISLFAGPVTGTGPVAGTDPVTGSGQVPGTGGTGVGAATNVGAPGAPPDAPFAARAGSFHSIEGMPHFLSATAAAHLLDLRRHFELVWCSGWEERANEHLPHLLGLPPSLPFLRFERGVGRTNAHWKLAAIDGYAGERPLAWIDDALNAACHEWARARAAPTLLVQTQPELGLTEREAALLARWAQGLAHTDPAA